MDGTFEQVISVSFPEAVLVHVEEGVNPGLGEFVHLILQEVNYKIYFTS